LSLDSPYIHYQTDLKANFVSNQASCSTEPWGPFVNIMIRDMSTIIQALELVASTLTIMYVKWVIMGLTCQNL